MKCPPVMQNSAVTGSQGMGVEVDVCVGGRGVSVWGIVGFAVGFDVWVGVIRISSTENVGSVGEGRLQEMRSKAKRKRLFFI
jgi:hypothetical protein